MHKAFLITFKLYSLTQTLQAKNNSVWLKRKNSFISSRDESSLFLQLFSKRKT